MNFPRARIEAPLASSSTQLGAKGLGFEHSREVPRILFFLRILI